MSFIYAFKGIRKGFGDRNMKIHGLITVLVILLGWFYKLSLNEWIVVLILISLVWSAELVNSSIENLNNTVRDTNKLKYEATTDSRDLAAGSVLVMAIISVIIGLIIFIPKIIKTPFF